MSYADLVAIDERTELVTVPVDKLEFPIRETERGNRVFVKLDGVEVPIKRSPRQFEGLCNFLGVPFKFAENVSQDLLRNIFSEMVLSKGEEPYNWAIDTQENEIISYGSARKPYIPYSMVGDILSNKGLDHLDGSLIRRGGAEITGTSTREKTVEPRVGDVVETGVNVRINPTNDTPPQVTPWSLRLICTNGMTTMDERESIRVVGHTVDDVLEQIEYQADRAMRIAEQMNHRFADMVDHRVDDPGRAMQNLILSRRGIPARVREMLIQEANHLPEDQRTMYDILNVFTAYASGYFDPDRRFELQAIGGNVALNHHFHCGSCGQELN